MPISNIYVPPKSLGGNFNVNEALARGTSPRAKALGTIATDPNASQASVVPKTSPTLANTLTPAQQAQYDKTLSMFSKPTTDLKSVTTSPDGTHTAVYHAPEREKTATRATSTSSTPNTTFPGLVNTGANISTNAANTGGANYNQANTGLIGATQGNQQYADRARDIATSAGQRISEIGGLGARNAAGYRTTGTSPVGEGNAAVQLQTTAAQQQAVAQGANMELAGNAQGLTAQNQIQAGFNQSSTNALSAQGQGLAGINNAAGLISPVQVPYNNQFVDPTTGQPINPQDSQSMNDAVALQVSKLKSGATDPTSAKAALAAYGQAGVNALEQALGVGFNPNISSANQSSAQDLTSQKNQLQSTFNGVEANYQLLINTARAGGVNDTNVPALNALQQNVAKGLTSNEAVINFRNTLAAVRAGYAQILGGGTTTVDSQNRAEQAVPDNISLGALQSLGQQLKNEATNRITGIDQQIKTLTSGSTSSGASSLFSW